jgi:hypothetical protein
MPPTTYQTVLRLESEPPPVGVGLLGGQAVENGGLHCADALRTWSVNATTKARKMRKSVRAINGQAPQKRDFPGDARSAATRNANCQKRMAKLCYPGTAVDTVNKRVFRATVGP